MLASILTLSALILFLSSCGSQNDIFSVAGTLESSLPTDSAPSAVLEAMERAERYHQYEIMSDTANSISVEAIAEADTIQTEGYGIVVVKGATSTTFPNLRNTRSPMAAYDKQRAILWLSCSAIEGTGIHVDWLHQIRFNDGDEAYIAHTLNPYDLQQQLCQRLGYTIDGQDITLWDDTNKIVTVTNTVTNMGGFDDELPVWIGEQITYDLTGPEPHLLITPGVKYVTGLVLTYDDLPTLAAPLAIADDGTVSIGKLVENK